MDTKWGDYRCRVDTERLGWARDRKAVAALEGHGDLLSEARRVDHWIQFGGAVEREAFITAATELGFAWVPKARTDRTPAAPLSVHLFRTDSVRLGDIHEVTTLLTALALQHCGEYDCWETNVEMDS
jgi:Regulator of ribonuclease activity B